MVDVQARRAEAVVPTISVTAADQLMFIYLQESSVTLKTIKMITLASL